VHEDPGMTGKGRAHGEAQTQGGKDPLHHFLGRSDAVPSLLVAIVERLGGGVEAPEQMAHAGLRGQVEESIGGPDGGLGLGGQLAAQPIPGTDEGQRRGIPNRSSISGSTGGCSLGGT
jgi:hypothetical protein